MEGREHMVSTLFLLLQLYSSLVDKCIVPSYWSATNTKDAVDFCSMFIVHSQNQCDNMWSVVRLWWLTAHILFRYPTKSLFWSGFLAAIQTSLHYIDYFEVCTLSASSLALPSWAAECPQSILVLQPLHRWWILWQHMHERAVYRSISIFFCVSSLPHPLDP